jgi:Raf kinase inhibitor-like YbhB/YbcL family protein
LAWNVAGTASGIAGGAHPEGIEQGENDFGSIGYRGPRPDDDAPHRYVFQLYALDRRLGLSPGATPHDFRRAIEGHVLAEARLVGTYRR